MSGLRHCTHSIMQSCWKEKARIGEGFGADVMKLCYLQCELFINNMIEDRYRRHSYQR